MRMSFLDLVIYKLSFKSCFLVAIFDKLMTAVVEALPRPVLGTQEKCAYQQRLVILL